MGKTMYKNFKTLLTAAANQMNICLDKKETALFKIYAEELLEWNQRINLTAIKDIEDIIIKHFVDSLSVIKHIAFSGKIADIGSGAGFPGLPLKIKQPALEVVLIESVRKKASFLNHIIRVLGLKQISVYNGRVEGFVPDEKFDFVLSRAFSSLHGCLEVSMPLLKKGGSAIFMRGKNTGREILLEEEPGISCVRSFELPFGRGQRSIVVAKKS